MKLFSFIIGAITLISATAAAPSTFSKDRCGPEYGDCDSGYCCSKYNWCGTSDDHCLLSRGCQSEFGECRGTSTRKSTTTSGGSKPTNPTNSNINAAIKWAGYRFSPSGPKKTLDRDPTTDEWMKYIKKFKSHFESDTKGAVLLIVGHEHDKKYCEFLFPKSSSIGSYSSNIKFEKKDKYEEFLNACDKNDIHVWLQVEPGSNDLVELVKIALSQYGHHPSVKGFGVDLEWWYRVDNSKGKKISDSEAEKVVKAVRKFNSDYTVFVKHWKPEFMPPTYRDHLIFVDDSQGFDGSFSKMKKEFGEWAEKFRGNPVMYQVGYKNDKSIWENDPIGVAEAVAETAKNYNDSVGIFWVDFTMGYAINK
ncbi:carbohydrate-binding module family 18 protein [Piromyces sp. E2]|nr:carbohydrate-binding module family 18 protein [Piromyces sp. E2]|eukprot:OUM57635.1 carbohydrate-binding module family 18 protein [Piromyces sp. E2]